METEFYGEGQHNGGVFFWGNLNPYIYTYQNPIRYIDPKGKQTIPELISDFEHWVHESELGHKIEKWGNSHSDEEIANRMSYTPLAPLFYAGELAQNYNEDGELPIQEIAEVVIVKTTKKVGFFDKIAAKLGLKNTKHTFNRHVNKSKHIEKSKYSKPNQIDKLTKKTINKPDKVTKQRNGRIVYEKDFGRK